MTLSRTASLHAASDQPAVITPANAVDVTTAPYLGAQVLEQLDQGARAFVLDFGCVHLIDSAGIGVLLSVQRRIQAAGGDLVVANVSDHVRHVLDLTGVSRSLPIE